MGFGEPTRCQVCRERSAHRVGEEGDRADAEDHPHLLCRPPAVSQNITVAFVFTAQRTGFPGLYLVLGWLFSSISSSSFRRISEMP